MGKKDIILKQYLSDNRRFAEIFNNALFEGEAVIQPDKLKPVDSSQAEVIALQETAAEFIQKNRDIAKIYNEELELVILGIENQNDVHYPMPLRVMLYDALSYDKQYQSIKKEHQREKDITGTERISGFSRQDRLIPVITLVIYYGTDAWDGPRSLADMLRLPKAFSSRKNPVNSYPMHLLEVQAIKDLEVYDDDLMALFGFIKYQKNRSELEAFIQAHASYFYKVPRETYEAIKNVADIKEMSQYIEKEKEEKEAVNMCDALKQLKEESIQQGMQKGRREGRQEGVRQVAIKLLRMNHPIPFIAQATDLSEAEIQKLKETLQKAQQ